MCIQTKNKSAGAYRAEYCTASELLIASHTYIAHCGQVETGQVSMLGFYRQESEGHWDMLMGYFSHETAVVQGGADNNVSTCPIKHIPSIDPSIISVIQYPPFCVYSGPLVGCRYFTAAPSLCSLVELVLMHIYLCLSKLTVPQALFRL